MKKSLIALAVVGAFTAQAAMADSGNVTIYGQANVSFDMLNNGNGVVPATQGTGANHVSSNASRIGMKGTEDLGGGTSAVWQIEQGINTDVGGLGGSRNTFAGLTGESWGTAILGNHDTPYKLATRGLDLFADTIADNRSLMGDIGLGTTSHDARLGNVLAYISPAMSGFTAAVAYVAGAEGATLSSQTKGSAWSLAGMYNAGPINASLSYQVVDGGDAPGSLALSGVPAVAGVPTPKATAWKIGGGYTMDAFQVNAAYEKTSDNFGGNAIGPCGIFTAGSDCLGRSAYYLAGKFNVSESDAVKLAYTHAGDLNLGGNSALVPMHATQFSLGYDHAMSKRTTVYALYTKISNNANSFYDLNPGAGAATSGGFTVGGTDADPSAFSLGMKHSF